ncbi:MAG TPA: DUF1203 domain-containing protein [Thermoanaerobaculia bacterium]|nr:DUF1203 domain-containing protein [Thermoanaerobaculia bacterium]
MKINILPLPQSFLDRVRNEGLDDQGQPVKRSIAIGGEPCRDVLRRALPGEEIILASYSPYAQSGPYKEFGPVFVLANPGDDAIPRDELPLGDYFRDRFVLRAYDRSESIHDAVMVTGDEAPEVIERFLASNDVAFVQARFPVRGCFACKIERVAPES